MPKGLSPLISVAVLIVISISTASLIATWMYGLTVSTANETQSSTEKLVRCRSAGLDFDPSYGYYGVDYNLSGNATPGNRDWIRAKVTNTGNLDLYGFSFEVELLNGTEELIEHYEATAESQKTAANPLRPGRSAIITADIETNMNESTTSITEVRVINPVCPDLSPSIGL